MVSSFFYLKEVHMNYNIEYLLRYISNETYKKILKNKSPYVLSLVEDNYIDTDLNIKYLIKYGVKNIDKIVYDSLEDLTISHNNYLNKIKEYINKTNRRVTFEYIMLDNVNDSEENAKELALLLKGINCYVNLIPYNETENIKFKRTKEWKIMKFYDILKKNKINVTIRKEFGGSVDAACGQLRANN